TAPGSTTSAARSSTWYSESHPASFPSRKRSATRNSSSLTSNSNRSDLPACRRPDRKGASVKLVRFGAAGAERPGLVIADGSIADLSGVIADVTGTAWAPEGLKKLAAVDATKLSRAPAGARLGACVG